MSINRNMRCIEIDDWDDEEDSDEEINRNMRCIEILFCSFSKYLFYDKP